MSEGARVPLEEARDIAVALSTALLPSCYRVEICGSIRRQRKTVGDIDLVCEPIMKPIRDMFDQETSETRDLLTECLDSLVQKGHLEKRLDKNGRASWGAHLKRARFRGLNVDIQSVTDEDTWGAWIAIRTGPAEFNKALVTPRSQGGVLPSGFEFRDGFKLYRFGGQVPTPTERMLFAALGLEHQLPQDRGSRPVPAQPAPAGGETDWRPG